MRLERLFSCSFATTIDQLRKKQRPKTLIATKDQESVQNPHSGDETKEDELQTLIKDNGLTLVEVSLVAPYKLKKELKNVVKGT